MAKKDDRPIDVGLVALAGKDDATAIEWWKQRFALIAAIPQPIARVGALTPQLRELSRLPPAERRRLTKARITAVTLLTPEVRETILTARKAAFAVDPAVLASDQAIVDELTPTIPGAAAVYKLPD